MRTILHLSDLHFGSVDERLVSPLIDVARALRPDLIVISGDLTQRARTCQFREARTFLDALPARTLVVPGNHDVPMRNPLARFWRPLTKYRRHVSHITEPIFIDDEIAVIGLNSARSFTIKGGRISAEQVSRVRAALVDLPKDLVKILVCHHPFDLHASLGNAHVAGGARAAIEALAGFGIDLILSGHYHLCYTGHGAERYVAAGRSIVFVQAGTALSTRCRGEPNAFNLLRIWQNSIEVVPFAWNETTRTFEQGAESQYERGPNGWFPTQAQQQASSLPHPSR